MLPAEAVGLHRPFEHEHGRAVREAGEPLPIEARLRTQPQAIALAADDGVRAGDECLGARRRGVAARRYRDARRRVHRRTDPGAEGREDEREQAEGEESTVQSAPPGVHPTTPRGYTIPRRAGRRRYW